MNLYLPQGWTGIEAGLSTTTRSSVILITRILESATGTSCLQADLIKCLIYQENCSILCVLLLLDSAKFLSARTNVEGVNILQNGFDKTEK